MAGEGNGRREVGDGKAPSPESVLWERRCALALWGITFGLYVLSAAPGLYWLDSGELTAAAFQLGTAHPPGFPLHSLLAKAATLLPLGSVSFRVVLLSAMAAACAVTLVFLLAARLTRSVGASPVVSLTSAGAGALLVALGHGFWRQATVTEVYSLGAVAAVGSLLLLWRLRETGDPRLRLLLAFVAGLATFGSHPDYRLLVLPVLLVAWVVTLRRGGRSTRAVPALFALGALVVLYLVAVADRGRLPDWGQCSSFGALWDHVMAARIRGAEFSGLMLSPRWEVVRHHLGLAWEIIGGPFVGIAIPLAAVGAGRLVTRPGAPRLLGIALLWAGLGDFVYSFWINPMGLEDLQNGTTAVLCLGLLAAVGLTTTALWIGQRAERLVPAVAAALAVITVLPTAVDSAAEKWSGAGYGAAAWSDAALDQAPTRAVILTSSDNLSAGLMHAQQVEGARPDVLVLVRQHVWVAHDLRTRLQLDADARLPRAAVREYLGRTATSRKRSRLNLLAQLLAASRKRRAVMWEPGDGVDLPALGRPLRPGVPLFRAVAPSSALPDAHRLVERLRWVLRAAPGEQAARVRSFHLNALGMQYLRRRRGSAVLGLAQELFRLALQAWPLSVAARINGGVVLARRAELAAGAGQRSQARGLLERAASATERALGRAPNRYVGLMNAGRYRLRLAELSGPADGPSSLGQARRARVHFERARRVRPELAAPHFNLGVLAARVQRYRVALDHFRAAVTRAPHDEAARVYLKRVQDALKKRGQ